MEKLNRDIRAVDKLISMAFELARFVAVENTNLSHSTAMGLCDLADMLNNEAKALNEKIIAKNSF